jgi:hypothetical protein
MVQQRGEPSLGSASRRRVHPLQPALQGDPALRPALVLGPT